MQRILFAIQELEHLTMDDIRGRIEEQIGEIDSIRERLEIDAENRPLKLLGLTASWDLIN